MHHVFMCLIRNTLREIVFFRENDETALIFQP